MAKITAKANASDGTEYDVDLGAKTVTLNVAGNLSAGSLNGITGKALFGSLSDLWKSGSTHNRYRFPFAMSDGPISTMLELRGGWTFASDDLALLRDCGVRYTSDFDGSTVTKEWVCFVQGGSVADSADQPYYLIGSDTTPSNFGVANEFNECVKVYDSGAALDKRSAAYLYIRENGDTYGYYDLTTEQEISAVTYRKYLVPMTTRTDTQRSELTPSGSPYSGMTLTLGATTNTINSTSYDFAEGIIDANGGTVQQVYDWFKYITRRGNSSDIDAGAGTQRGDTYATGDLTLSAGVLTTSQGLAIENIASADESNVIQVDDTGTGRQEAFVPTFTVACVDSDGSPANFATGARVQIYDTTNTSELYNNTPGAVTSIGANHSAGGTVTIRYRVRSVNGSTGATQTIQGTASISTANVTVNVVQQTDTVYVDNLVDGSAVTGLTINANKIDIDANRSSDTLSWQEIYGWYTYYLTTEDGIRDSADLITANTQTSYTVDDTLEIKNTKTGSPLTITGANVTDASGSYTGWVDTSGENIYVIPDSVVPFSYGSGALSAPQIALLTTAASYDVPTVTEIREEVDSNSTQLAATVKLLKNKTVTDPTLSKMTVYDDDGTTPLYEANLYDDVDAATPWTGTAAINRRDNLT